MIKKTTTGKREEHGIIWLITRYTLFGITLYERRVDEVTFIRYRDHITSF